MLLLTSVLAGSSIVYTHYAHRQWTAMNDQLTEMRKSRQSSDKSFEQTLCQMQAQTAAQQESNRITKESLISVQRAVVLPSGEITGGRFGPPNSVGYMTLAFGFENVGSTATRGMLMHLNYDFMTTEIPRTFDFHDLRVNGKVPPNTPAVLGPHAKNASISTDEIPAVSIKAIEDHQLRMYIWGWVRYRDIFKDTPRPLTEFCYELTGFTEDPLVASNDKVIPKMVNCPMHNCWDEDCKDYKP